MGEDPVPALNFGFVKEFAEAEGRGTFMLEARRLLGSCLGVMSRSAEGWPAGC